jgi:hypothetical protein
VGISAPKPPAPSAPSGVALPPRPSAPSGSGIAAPLKPASAAPRPAVAAPAAIKPVATASSVEAKKGTSKVEITPPMRPAPQATVKIASASPSAAATPSAAIKTAEAAPAATEAAPDSLTGILAIAATVVALAALGVQVWMFL